MSKQTKERPNEETAVIPVRFQHQAAIGLLVLSLVIFFREPLFQGKIFLATDNIASQSFNTYMADAREEGVFPLWNPYIFCGMPGYGSLTVTGDRWFDLSGSSLHLLHNIFGVLTTNSEVGRILFYYVLLAIGMYLLAFHKLRQKIPAFLVALATIYSTYIIIWIMSGHNTKIFATATFPFIFLLIESLREKMEWWKLFALTVAIHYLLLATHVQITFYVFLAVGGYLLWYWIGVLRKKETWKSILRPSLAFVAAALAAFLMDSDRYLSVLEYNPYSIRGSGPITETLQAATKSADGGLDYEYATNWSLGVGEAFTMFIPSLYGFGNVDYQGRLSNGQEIRLPLYFGPQPFTDAPQYMGIVVLLLAIIGFWRFRTDPFVQYLGIMIGFSMLVAFGKEFPLVYDLMYKYFPTFNKFRVPSMILVLVQIMVPFLAGYGLVSFIQKQQEHLTPASEKKWKYVLAALAGLFVIGLVGRGFYAAMYRAFFPPEAVYQHYAQRLGIRSTQVLAELYDFLTNLVVTDVVVALFLLLLTFGSLFLFIRRSLRLSTLAVILSLVVIIDLWRVNTQPMEPRERNAQQSVFSPSPAVSAILAQERGASDSSFVTPYRVLEFENGQPPLNNMLAYWRIQSAFGYQGAKMRRYQDLVDVVGLHHPILWQIMNVKYIITDRADSSRALGLLYDGPDQKVYVNRLVLPRVFFANSYEVADGIGALRKMSELRDARDVVYLAEDPEVKIRPPFPGTQARIVKYGIQHLTVELRTYADNLLFLSESYYPEGWKAFLDGKEVSVLRANYHFRAVVVPPGEHVLEMVFEPSGFAVGKYLSLGTNIVVLAGLSYFGWSSWRKSKT